MCEYGTDRRRDVGLKILCAVFKVCVIMAQWLSWLERRPVTAKVTGSNPVWVVYLLNSV